MPNATRLIVRQSAARAFTLIEVLIVVGILGLLAALSVIGFKVVGGVSRDKVTDVALGNCNSLLNNYKLTNTVDTLLDTPSVNGIVTATRWEASTAGTPNSVKSCFAQAPGMTTGGAARTLADRAKFDRFLRDETARVIRRLTSVPENRKAIEALSQDRIVRVRFPGDATSLSGTNPAGIPAEYPAATVLADGVNLLDGSGHPVYFIPGGGLRGVNVGYKGTGDKADPLNYDRAAQAVRAPDQQPFWASPGPDGDLTTGDDNAYSFDGK